MDVTLETMIPLGTPPPLTDLPPGLPWWANPPGGTLVDAAEIDGAILALFHAPGEVTGLQQAYVDALAGAGIGHRIEPFATGVTFRIGEGPDQIILEAADGGVRVSLAVTP